METPAVEEIVTLATNSSPTIPRHHARHQPVATTLATTIATAFPTVFATPFDTTGLINPQVRIPSGADATQVAPSG